MLMQHFGATNKEHYGIIWYFLEWSIALFTDTPAILNLFDLGSIMACPGGMSTCCLYLRAPFKAFFLKVFLEYKACNGKKDRRAVFGCNHESPNPFSLIFL